MHKIIYLILITAAVAFPGIHNNMRTTQVHSPFRWVFADSAARVAESVTASDTDKVAYQKSDSSLWVLRDNDPKTWIELNNHIGSLDVDSIDTRVVKADSMIFGTAGYVKCDSGSYACTLYVYSGSLGTQTDTVGVLYWQKIGNFVSVMIDSIDFSLINSSIVAVDSFPADIVGYGSSVSLTSISGGSAWAQVIEYSGIPDFTIINYSGSEQRFTLPCFNYLKVTH